MSVPDLKVPEPSGPFHSRAPVIVRRGVRGEWEGPSIFRKGPIPRRSFHYLHYRAVAARLLDDDPGYARLGAGQGNQFDVSRYLGIERLESEGPLVAAAFDLKRVVALQRRDRRPGSRVCSRSALQARRA